MACVIALLAAVALVFDPTLHDAFRLPKLVAAEGLGLASLLVLALGRLGSRPPIEGDLLRSPVVLASAALAGAFAISAAASSHPFHVHEALIHGAIGLACLLGWSLGLSRERLVAALRAAVAPAVLLAVLGILQAYELFQPFGFADVSQRGRLAAVSLAGNAGDLGTALVLPCLAAVTAALAGGRRRVLWIVAAAIVFFGLCASQTLSALAAVLAGAAVAGVVALEGRSRLRFLGLVAAAAAIAFVATPVAERGPAKVAGVARGDLNDLLSGRLDGWRVAVAEFLDHPVVGTGLGAFRAEFVPVKLRLLHRGAKFYPAQRNVVFADAHDEPLQLAAETGFVGLVAAALALALFARRLRALLAAARGSGRDRSATALLAAGVTAFALLALFQFPFRIAITAYPALVLAAAVFARPAVTAEAER